MQDVSGVKSPVRQPKADSQQDLTRAEHARLAPTAGLLQMLMATLGALCHSGHREPSYRGGSRGRGRLSAVTCARARQASQSLINADASFIVPNYTVIRPLLLWLYLCIIIVTHMHFCS